MLTLGQEADAAWASTEVLLRTEGDEEERRDAVEAAKALLEAEGFPDHLLQARRVAESLWLM